MESLDEAVEAQVTFIQLLYITHRKLMTTCGSFTVCRPFISSYTPCTGGEKKLPLFEQNCLSLSKVTFQIKICFSACKSWVLWRAIKLATEKKTLERSSLSHITNKDFLWLWGEASRMKTKTHITNEVNMSSKTRTRVWKSQVTTLLWPEQLAGSLSAVTWLFIDRIRHLASNQAQGSFLAPFYNLSFHPSFLSSLHLYRDLWLFLVREEKEEVNLCT